MGKTLHVGIDQTGAIDRSGTPRPLPACLINGQEVTFFYLDSFSKKDLLKNIKSINNLVICVDCVLGLPQELALPWRKTLELIQAHQGYGRIPAKNFFLSLSDGRIIRRQIEIACNANSVFKEKPFQKNIQTGTYRIWKDIAKAPADFAVPFLMEVPKKNQIPIYEGYPTLSWKLLFNVKFRQPEKFFDLIKKYFPQLSIAPKYKKMVSKDPNFADAFVLALSLKLFNRKASIAQGFENEGFILGFN